MQVMKWSVIALAVAAGTSELALASAQSESKGFVEDSSLNLVNRSVYFNRDYRNSDNDNRNAKGERISKREELGYGVIGTFESGFTQGTVGFGFDAIGLLGAKLDSGGGRVGTGLFPTDSDGDSQDDYSKAGGAVKARISNTVIKYGEQFVALPVLATDDSRLLPETAEGLLLTSNEIDGLELNAGRFTAGRAQDQSERDSLGITKIDLAGGTYSFTDDLSASFYYSKTEDVFRKYYGNLNYNLPLSDTQALGFDFNIYDTKGTGDNLVTSWDGDKLDSRVWSLAGSYSISAHKFTIAHQRNSGDGGYQYGVGDFGGTIFLANSVQRSDFQEEGMKSWQARYDLNMASFGVPGLTFMTRYVTGDDGKTAAQPSNSKEWERNIEAKYVFQDGAAKDLSLRVRQATYRSNFRDDIDEVRVIVEYPLSVL